MYFACHTNMCDNQSTKYDLVDETNRILGLWFEANSIPDGVCKKFRREMDEFF